MDALKSWAIALSIGGGFAYYYYTTSVQKSTLPRGKSAAIIEGVQAPLKTAKKALKSQRNSAATPQPRANDSPATSSSERSAATAIETAKGKANGKSKAPSPAAQKQHGSIEESEASRDDADNKDWAEQMVNMRKGTNLAPPSKDGSRARTVKTSGRESGNSLSSASSTGGSVADDNKPSTQSSSARAGDVSDMLEPTSSAPSVLRLTEPANAKPQRAQQPKKEVETAETKKQRQNKKKNEERRAAVEAQEQDRKKLLEAQRRTAREARGEPLRNGLQQSAPPTDSAWTNNTSPTEPQSGVAPPVQPLLDTFDRSQAPAVGNAQASVMPAIGADAARGLSEQEQLDVATKMSGDDSGWNTVATGKKGKKAAPVSESGEVKPQPEPVSRPTRSIPPPAPIRSATSNGFASLDDSDWAA